MKAIVFDSGPIISLAMNNLLWILDPLKKSFGGEFYIPKGVKQEIVDKPLQGKKYKFEALQVLSLIKSGVLTIIDNDRINKESDYLLHLGNSCFNANENNIKIMHYGEIQVLAAANYLNADAIVIDERTTRLIIEKPKLLNTILQKKLHTNVSLNENNLNQFREHSNIKVIRSVELVSIAYKLGLLDKFLPSMKNQKKILLDAALWGVKLNGCSVSREEINQLLRIA